MFAKDIMTTKVITVLPDAQMQEIAQLLLKNHISAVPVVNAEGKLVGVVSEGDLTGRNTIHRIERSQWWLNLLAEGEEIAPEFLKSIQQHSYKASDIMSSPVISVNATTDVKEVARLLTEHRINRVPVLEDGCIAGIVSRADLLRVIASVGDGQVTAKQEAHKAGMGHYLYEVFNSVDKHFYEHMHHATKTDVEKEEADNQPQKVTAKDFQLLVNHFKHEALLKEQEERRHVIEQHKKTLADLISHHVDDTCWQSIMHNAKEAAERGEKEYMILRFPSELCCDGGRAVNIVEPGWQNTLRGEAADMYMRWQHNLKPQGFRLIARILDYPNGFPGDIGFFLAWGS